MKKFVLIGLLLVGSPSWAVKCYITAMKANCWANYSATIEAFDRSNNQPLLKPIIIEKGKNWQRASFECQPEQGILYKASFKPAIWADGENKKYAGKRIWYLPKALKKGEAAWNLPICFSYDFSGVPIPPTATDNCNCDSVKTNITPLP